MNYEWLIYLLLVDILSKHNFTLLITIKELIITTISSQLHKRFFVKTKNPTFTLSIYNSFTIIEPVSTG